MPFADEHDQAVNSSNQDSSLFETFRPVSHRLISLANQGILRIDFLREVSHILAEVIRCDSLELLVMERGKYYKTEMTNRPHPIFQYRTIAAILDEKNMFVPDVAGSSDMERLCLDMIRRRVHEPSPFFTTAGSLWMGDTTDAVNITYDNGGEPAVYHLSEEPGSLAIIPFETEQRKVGLLLLKSSRRNFFTLKEIEFYEGLAQTLGVAFIDRRAQIALRERVKELTCLCSIAKLAADPDVSVETIVQGILGLLPSAVLYPDIACVRIALDNCMYVSSGFREGAHKMINEITVEGEKRGELELTYTEERPELDEGPFLREERSLLDTVAQELALVLERKKAETEKIKLQDQLRHADRLATIGQLAAGVAHELNEPLGSILGFAQLARKDPELPQQIQNDLQKIENASLHAREIIQKLLTFARQTPPQKTSVQLNQVVREGLSFLESRWAGGGIEFAHCLDPDLPEITADKTQLHQVLVNLVVNAIQAMPDGGRLTVSTRCRGETVYLIVEDTGCGMSDEVMKHIFLPFFTTKEVGQGTGLGLAVVHGIVKSHAGSIYVDSNVGRGTRFEIQLPVKRE